MKEFYLHCRNKGSLVHFVERLISVSVGRTEVHIAKLY